MSLKISLKKGLDLNIVGAIADTTVHTVATQSVALAPDDFPGFVPKLEVKEGDIVKAGQPLFHDKNNEQIKLVSPASGIVTAVVRGERRKIERIIISVDNKAEQATATTTTVANRDDAKAILMKSGMWAMIRQRPYDIVPIPTETPRNIFVTGFDSAPLAPSMMPYLKGKVKELAAGVKLLSLLTDGDIYVSRRPGQGLADIPGTIMVDVEGPHPASNAGVIAANIKPVNKGETIWCLDATTLARIGAVMLTGRAPMDTIVGVTGPEVKSPRLISTVIGADIASLLNGNLKAADHHIRVVSGNLLSGKHVPHDGFLRFPYNHVSVIADGDDVAEFLGWATLSPCKQSVSRSFLGNLFRRPLNPDARLMGGRRAIIMSGEYDKVIPMDILAEYLIKAILSKNIDQMEALGIYEVAPEDFAVAEYVDTSKLPLQQIVREGLDYLRKELN